MVNTMENVEEVMQVLDRFTRLKQKEIPKELDEYLQYVAKTGDTVFKWSSLKYLFREKLLNVIKAFHDNSPRVDEIPQYPNVDPFNYESMKSSLLERLELFNAAPFTIQRLCELLIDPRKQYSRIDKFMRALEKNILVVSTVEPGRKRTESENADSLDSVVNGDLSLDVNVDIDMVENEGIFSIETQNGNGARPTAVAAAATSDSLESKEKLAVSAPIISDVGTNAVRSGDDDILPHPKKAKLDLHENNPKLSASENNGEPHKKADEEPGEIAGSDTNGSSVELIKEKNDADEILKKEEDKRALDKQSEKNGNLQIEENENNSKAKIIIEGIAFKENYVEMKEQKVTQQGKTEGKNEEPPLVDDKIVPEKTEKKEQNLEQGIMAEGDVVEENKIQEPENKKTNDKKEETMENIKNSAMKEKGEEADDGTLKAQDNISSKEIELVQQKEHAVVEEKPMVVEKLVENKDKAEDKKLSQEEVEKEKNNNANVEAVAAAVDKEDAVIAGETITKTSVVEENKKDNILENVALKIETESISSEPVVELTAKSEGEAEVKLSKPAEEKEHGKPIVQENISTVFTEKNINKSVENKTVVAIEEIPGDVSTEKATETVALEVKPTVIEQGEQIVFTSNIKASVDIVSPPEVLEVETPAVNTSTATEFKALPDNKTEKADFDTIVADEHVTAKSIESEKATTTTVEPITSAPLISASIKEDTFELPAVVAEDIINSAVVASTTAPPVLETLPIITETIQPTANDIIAPTLTLNDQPMEDLPMEESVPEEVIMADTVTAAIGSGLGVGPTEMATDAMEASSKDETPVDGMDVDDTSQEAMDQ